MLAVARSTSAPARRQEIAHRELVEEVIDFLEIEAVRKRTVGTLAYGLQKRVELGRALCMQPRAAAARRADGGHERRGEGGHGPLRPRRQRAAGVTIVLIEHDMGVVMDISDRVTVLDFGA